jgi:tetratricopeptide (TPR) repeat protein
MTNGLNIRLELLEPDDLLVALAYSWLSMAIASQGRYEEALVPQLKAGEILDGPAGKVPGRKLVWGYNASRNLYCLGRYEEADKILSESLADAETMESWYLLV